MPLPHNLRNFNPLALLPYKYISDINAYVHTWAKENFPVLEKRNDLVLLSHIIVNFS